MLQLTNTLSRAENFFGGHVDTELTTIPQLFYFTRFLMREKSSKPWNMGGKRHVRFCFD